MKRPSESRFFPLCKWQDPPQTGHGRIDLRSIDLLPAEALSEHMRFLWPSVQTIARIMRQRRHFRKGKEVKIERETVYLITSISQPEPEFILHLNRRHWRIETMHRDKDVTLGEDGYTNRSDHAPRNIFTLISVARTLLKRIDHSPTRAIEMVQNDRRKIRFLSNKQKIVFH